MRNLLLLVRLLCFIAHTSSSLRGKSLHKLESEDEDSFDKVQKTSKPTTYYTRAPTDEKTYKPTKKSGKTKKPTSAPTKEYTRAPTEESRKLESKDSFDKVQKTSKPTTYYTRAPTDEKTSKPTKKSKTEESRKLESEGSN